MKIETLYQRALSKIDDIFENRRLCYISASKEDCRLIKAKLLTKGFGYIVISKECRPDDALKEPRKKTCELLALDMKEKCDFEQLIDRLAKKLKNSSFQMLDGAHNSDSRISRIRPLVHQEALTATKHFIFNEEKDMATCTPEQIYDKFDRYLLFEGGVVTTIKRFKGFEIQNIAGVAAQIHDGM